MTLLWSMVYMKVPLGASACTWLWGSMLRSAQNLELLLLRGEVRLADHKCSLEASDILDVDRALLSAGPARGHKRTITFPCYAREFQVRLSLVYGRLGLAERRLRLGNLVIEFRCGDLRE